MTWNYVTDEFFHISLYTKYGESQNLKKELHKGGSQSITQSITWQNNITFADGILMRAYQWYNHLANALSPGAEGGPVCNHMSPNFDS